jgi:hypothetical protein
MAAAVRQARRPGRPGRLAAVCSLAAAPPPAGLAGRQRAAATPSQAQVGPRATVPDSGTTMPRSQAGSARPLGGTRMPVGTAGTEPQQAAAAAAFYLQHAGTLQRHPGLTSRLGVSTFLPRPVQWDQRQRQSRRQRQRQRPPASVRWGPLPMPVLASGRRRLPALRRPFSGQCPACHSHGWPCDQTTPQGHLALATWSGAHTRTC